MHARHAQALDQLRRLPTEYNAAPTEEEKAGILDDARILTDWLRSAGIEPPRLRFTSTPAPLHVEVTPSGPAYLLPGIEPTDVHKGSASQRRMF